MKLSELQKKDIINIKNGKKIGRIVDVEVDVKSGYMIHLIIESSHFVKSLFNNTDEINISFSQIKKLGEDVILIDF